MTDKRIALAEEVIGFAEKRITEAYHQKHTVQEKTHNDFVTEIDIEIENYAKQRISEAFADDGFYGEETDNVASKDGYEWVFDPIDGTNNFMRGWPLCGSQICILKNDEPMFSLISRPMSKERYWAKKGEGAWYSNDITKEESQLFVAKRELGEAIAIFDTKVGKSSSPSTSLFNKIVNEIAMTRVFGAAIVDLPSIAEGSADFLITGMAQKYDIAPGKLLIEEAGGGIFSVNGQASSLEDDLMILCSHRMKDQLTGLLN